MEKNKGAKGSKPKVSGSKRERLKDATPKLSDLGFTKKQSSDWQKLASLPLFPSPSLSRLRINHRHSHGTLGLWSRSVAPPPFQLLDPVPHSSLKSLIASLEPLS
jgi:hypothetical protein